MRHVALLLRIRDIHSRDLTERGLVTPWGVSKRVHIFGTVVFRGESEIPWIVLDDFTETVRVISFEGDIPADVGDFVEVIGRVDEREGERRVIAEIVKKKDLRWEILRRLEILARGTVEEL